MDFNSLAYSDNLSLYALSNNNLSKVLIGILGTWKGHHAGNFTLNKESMEEMINNFNSQKVDIVCDYEHQTLTGDTAPASGWIKKLTLEDDKLYAHVEWVDKAKELIKNKEYKYVSPVFQSNTTKGTTGNNIGWSLHSLSLTNRPFLEELGEVIANRNDNLISLKKENEKLITNNKKLETQVIELTKEKIDLFIDKAINANNLREEQREYALSLATQDFKQFEEFISNNRQIMIPESNIFANSSNNHMLEKGSTDIEDMVKIASKQTV